MHQLTEDSVQFIVTSPPYWQIKTYDHPDQIGYGQKYEEYLGSLQGVIDECYRVLSPGCRFALNIGDQYLSAKEHQRYRIQPIPADLTLRGQQTGFDFMGAIIWRKVTTTKTSGGGVLMGSMYFPRDGQITYEHEYILLFKKPGKGPKPTEEQKSHSELTKEERSKWFRGVWDDVHPARQSKGHPATFPVELPRRLIKIYSFWGETVLEPFMGVELQQ
jgi:site-specific DNA-methyltransferase (adenine-specific)